MLKFKFFLCILLLQPIVSFSQEALELNNTNEVTFFDKNGDLDLSEYMSQAYGFLPVPILITEPALGYGGGVALIYLHDTLLGKKSSSGRRIPPSISGAVVAGTENGTTALGAFHIGYWLEDTLRTATYIGKPDVFIDLYNDNRAFNMNLKGSLFYQSVKKRVMDTNLFLGFAYMYSSIDIGFDFEAFEEDFLSTATIASLSLLAEYDSRDNQLSPNSGQFLSLKAQIFDESLGGDYAFINYKTTNLFYNPLTEKINIDFNIVGESISGDKNTIPPYLYPFISMRGIPMMRYQAQNIVTIQTQVAYDVNTRWKVLAFGGVGKAFGEQFSSKEVTYNEAENIFAGGVGFRYLISKKFGLRVGIDLAKSKESETFYIQVGTAWKGF